MTRNNPFPPRKSLGQNFLINPHIIQRIIDSCDLKPTDTILEIGPGRGALTDALSQHANNVIAIEKDRGLAGQLKQQFENTNVKIIHADILKYPFDSLTPNMKVVGNLPYNIATPIITKIIANRMKCDALYATVQLEYGQRITAKPNTKSYGSFSCFVQYHADVKMLFKIKNTAFHPAPRVQSCFLQFNLLKKPKNKAKCEDLLFKIIRSCFGQRRKTIQNSLSGAMDKQNIPYLLQKLNINPKSRAENLSLEEYIQISNAAGQLVH